METRHRKSMCPGDRLTAILSVSSLILGASLSCSGAPPPPRPPQITWSELCPHAGGAKGAVQLASGDILATRHERRAAETVVVCSRSTDGGKSWQELSVIAKAPAGHDLGDGHLLQLPDGALLFSYRHNQHHSVQAGPRKYSIRIAVSHDAGATWQPHSVVAESVLDPTKDPEALGGLWSSFLLLKRDGTLQCYYDDEATPHQAGFYRHQWVTMKTWDPGKQQWSNPVTVSRANNRSHLSRDGMASVVELPSGRLLCALESVQTAPPHANCIRQVTSDDGGRTWSWQRQERQILYQPPRTNHLALSPWIARLPGGPLLCVFATDEDQPTPSPSGTLPWHMKTDIKCVTSIDDGRTWSSSAQTVFAGPHKSYAPGILPLRDGSLLVTFQDFSTGGHRAFRGIITP